MTRISRTVAENIAKEVIQPLADAQKKKIEELRKAARKILWSKVPTTVKNTFKKYPDYVETLNSWYLSGVGISKREIYISLDEQIPCIQYYVEMEKDEAKLIRRLYDEKQTISEQIDNKKIEISKAILGLGTVKRVQENLPQLIPFLEKHMVTNTAIAVNISEVKKSIVTLTKDLNKAATA